MAMQGNQGGNNKAKQSLDQAAKMFGRSDFAKHLAAGTASGWVTGIVLRHTGKSVALIVGSGIILHQIAHHNGYIKQDLDALKEMAQKKSNELGKTTPLVNKVRMFATKNKVFSAGFVGGFLIGIAL